MEDGESIVTISERMRQDAVAADAWHETHGEMASAASTLNGYAKEVEALEKENKRLKEHLDYRHEVILRGDPKDPEFVKMEREFNFASRHGTECGDDPVFDQVYDYAANLRKQLSRALEFIVWCGLNAANETGETVSQKAKEAEFRVNHLDAE